MKPGKKKRIFSKEEAEALLPELEKRLRHLQSRKEAYSRTHDALFMHELVRTAELSHGLFEEKDDLDAGIHALEEAIESLAQDVDAIFAMGCFLRSIERGHVEFFGKYGGQEVYFSWRVGEPSLGHYRLPGKTVHERVPLSEKNDRKKTK